MILKIELDNHKIEINDFVEYCFYNITGKKYSNEAFDNAIVMLINRMEFLLEKISIEEDEIGFDNHLNKSSEIQEELNRINSELNIDYIGYISLIKENYDIFHNIEEIKSKK